MLDLSEAQINSVFGDATVQLPQIDGFTPPEWFEREYKDFFEFATHGARGRRRSGLIRRIRRPGMTPNTLERCGSACGWLGLIGCFASTPLIQAVA